MNLSRYGLRVNDNETMLQIFMLGASFICISFERRSSLFNLNMIISVATRHFITRGRNRKWYGIVHRPCYLLTWNVKFRVRKVYLSRFGFVYVLYIDKTQSMYFIEKRTLNQK